MANTPRQRESWRDAIRFDNETDRYDLDSDLSRWKNSVSELQSKMGENKAALRKANDRYSQVLAAGGAGDYGINEYSAQAEKYRREIEGSRSGISTAPKVGNTLIKPLAEISDSITGKKSQIQAIEAEKANFLAPNFDKYGNKINPNYDKYYDSQLRNFDFRIKTVNDAIAKDQSLYDEQKPFQEDEVNKANSYNDRIKRLEQEFIQTSLNTPDPQPISLRGVKEEKTPQQVAMERDQAINSSLGDDLSIQKVAPSQKKPYLAKQQNSLPLRGYTMSNLRGASQRVSGATLGGNTNQLQ